jgi:two-component system response regulator PilR (NtrC family)
MSTEKLKSWTSAKAWREFASAWRARLVDFLWSTPEISDPAELRRTLGWLVFARLLILTVLLVLSAWHTRYNSQATNWLIITTYVISLCNVLWLRYSNHLRALGHIQLGIDVVLSTLAIYVTGSPVCIALYLIVLVGAAVLFSSHGAVITAVFSAFCYEVFRLLPPFLGKQPTSSPQDVLVIYSALVAVALVSGYLAKQRERLGHIALHQARDLSDLTERQRQLLNDVSEGIITTDLEEAITGINQAARAIIGLTDAHASQFVGRPFNTVLRDLGVSGAERILRQSATTEQHGEISLKSGAAEREVQLSYTARTLTNGSGNPAGRIFLFNDISHVRGMEEQLRLHERMTQLLAETDSGRRTPQNVHGDIEMIGESTLMRQIFALVDRVAASDASVLISGESGTGKELIARAVHVRGSRKSKPFVALNCGAIPENLIESELFGHKKGSFTGAVNDNPGLFRQAHGGTIFLDEIGELPLQMQTKLLRVLQEKRVRSVGDVHDAAIDVRVLAATNRDLKREIAASRFREDLFYRLNVVNIPVPPLRERKEDIPLLVRYFIGRFCDPDQVLPRISPDALQQLMNYPFPGNIRELENVIERALVLGGNAILPEHLPEDVLQGGKESWSGVGAARSGSPETQIITLPIDLEAELASLERHYITSALEQTGGLKKQAATLLGLNFRSFRYRLKKYGLGESQGNELDDNV